MHMRKLAQNGPDYPPGPAPGYTRYAGLDLAPDFNVKTKFTFSAEDCAAECNVTAKCLGFVMNNERNPTACYLKDNVEKLFDVDSRKFNTTFSYVRADQPVPIMPPSRMLSPPPAPANVPVGSPPSSVPSPPPSLVAPSPPTSSSPEAGVIVGVIVAVVLVLAALAGFCCFFLRRKRKKSSTPASEPFDGLKVYSYTALRTATSDFRDVLGGGGSAEVFRAELDGRVVAVKKLKEAEDRKTSEQEFTAEARGLGQLLHVNVVRLIGYSNDPKHPKMLIYEFVNGGSLESLLYGVKKEQKQPVPLSFARRMDIALGIARGIEYCHHSIDPPLIHRDIKPSNILMTSADDTGLAKVADFGLARILDPEEKTLGALLHNPLEQEEQGLSLSWQKASSLSIGRSSNASSEDIRTSSSTVPLFNPYTGPLSQFGNTTMKLPGAQCTSVAGTHGYIDPEYFRTGRATLKSDVYSFGILLLELIMEERPMHIYAHLQDGVSEHKWIPTSTGDANPSSYSYSLGILLEQGEAAASQVIPMLAKNNPDSRKCFEALKIARQCLQDKGKLRPQMRQVVRMLEQLSEDQAKGDPN